MRKATAHGAAAFPDPLPDRCIAYLVGGKGERRTQVGCTGWVLTLRSSFCLNGTVTAFIKSTGDASLRSRREMLETRRTPSRKVRLMVFWIVVATMGGPPSQPVALESRWLVLTLDPSGSFAVRDKRTQSTWTSGPPFAPFRNLAVGRNRITFETDAASSDGHTFPVTVTIGLEDECFVVEVDTDDRNRKVGRFKVLPPLLPLSAQSELLLPYYGNGIVVPVTDKRFQSEWWETYGRLDMPWVGLMDGEQGYMVLWDGRSADDGLCITEGVKTDKGDLLAPVVYHEPTVNRFGYPRRVRYIFVAKGCYVALCKQYRGYAKRTGLLLTLEQKAKRNPQVRLLAGAPNVWGGNPQFAREAKAAGIERLLVNGVWAAEEMQSVRSLGYLNSRYDNYEDLYTCCPNHDPPYNVGSIEDCVLRADGQRQVSWVTWDKKHTSHKRCSALQLDIARKYIEGQLAKHPHNAWFLDVTTATWLIECYDPKHSHDRTQDREAKRKLAKLVGTDLGLVLGGEHGRWWGADLFDYWEGMMSINPFFTWPAGHLRPPEKKEEIGEAYLEWGLGHRRRLPLWELVFHDCVVSYWYWGDTTDFLYRLAPELTDKKDAFNILYGTPPMFWVGDGVKAGFLWEDPKLRRRLLQSYRHVCKLHEQIAFQEMLSHQWLTPDRDVQRTVFGRNGTTAGRTEVIVNFGEKPYTVTVNGHRFILPQYGFYARGPLITQYRTLVGDRTVTFINTSDYLFCDAAGKRYDFGTVITDGQVTLNRPSNRQIGVTIGKNSSELVLRPFRFAPNFNLQSARLIWLKDDGTPSTVDGLNQLKKGRGRDVALPLPCRAQKALIVW